MQVSTTGIRLYRNFLALLCLLTSGAIGWGDQPRRNLESYRVQFKPSQQVRMASVQEPDASVAPPRADAGADSRSGESRASSATQTIERSALAQPLMAVRGGVQQQPVAVCSAVCDVLAEPVCGLDAACDCDACAGLPEPACGIEVGCGVEAGCGAGAGCGGGSICRCEPPGGGRYCWNWNNVWFRGEYLLGWVDGFSVPPLLTTSAQDTSIEDAGVLGLPTTSIVVGNETRLDDVRSGGRFTLGYWLDPCQNQGIEAIYTGLGKESSRTRVGSEFPILARPFFNVEPGAAIEDAELISFPGVLEGNALVEFESTIQSVELLYRHAICQDCCYRVDGLIGWRYARLDEKLRFSDFKRVLSDDIGLPIGTTLAEFDQFKTRNEFHGPELGVAATARYCPWTVECLMKLALGNNRSRVAIDGQSVFNVPGGQPPVTVTPAGLLAQATNIGVHTRDDFTVIPELGVTLGYDLNCCWRATVGYSFLYWCHVARPGDQIDRELNLTQLEPSGLEGAARPAATRRLDDVWVQGLRFGLEAHL